MKFNLLHLIHALACAIIFSTVCIEPVAAIEGAAATAADESGSSSRSPAKAKRSGTRTPAVRTLDAITIEGEIAVPQVLFITSRDYPRYRDGLGLKFRMTTLDVARSVDLPTRLRIVAKHKEEGQ